MYKILTFASLLLVNLLVAAQPVSELSLEEPPIELLGGRLKIQMPPDAELEPRQRSVMAAPESPEQESRIVLDVGERRMVVMACEIYATATKDFKKALRKYYETDPDKIKIERIVKQEDFQVYLTTPEKIEPADEAIYFATAWVINKDNTIQLLHGFANPEAAKDEADMTEFFVKVFKTIRPGDRKLNLSARTHELSAWSDTKHLVIDLPVNYVTSTQRGPDFLIHHINSVVPFGEPSYSIGIYLGDHPNYHHKRFDDEEIKTESSWAPLLEASAEWYESKAEGFVQQEAICPVPQVDDRLKMHVFFSAPSRDQVQKLRSLVDTLRFKESQE